MSRTFLFAAAVATAAVSVHGQPQVQLPHYTAPAIMASGIAASGASLASDRYGNVYIVDKPTSSGLVMPPSVTLVTFGGVVVPNHATGFGNPGQLARNPLDGFVYVVDYSPVLPVIDSRILRIELGGGTTVIAHVPVTAQGFAIDSQGRWILGGTGFQGPGVYLVDPASPGTVVFLGSGFMSNGILASMVDGAVMIAEGRYVHRMPPGGGNTTVYYTFPFIGNTFPAVHSVTRDPMNARGAGAMIGVTELTTLCGCGTGLAVFNDLAGTNETSFATEPYMLPQRGLRALADGARQDLFWYGDAPNLPVNQTGILYRMSQLPAPSEAGSLLVAVNAPSIAVSLFGSAAGSEPFLLGFTPPPPPAAAWYPTIGLVGLDPLGPLYVPLLEGFGLFGPVNPAAVTGPSGAFFASYALPPGTAPFQIQAQAGILSASAPNGLLYLSNVVPVSFP